MKTIHPAIAEHVMEENEKLRGLLREALTELLAMKAEIGFRGNTIAVIGRIDAALSQQANQATDGGRNPRYEGLFEDETEQQRDERLANAKAEPAPAQDEREAVEVVAVLYKSGDVLTAEECGIALEVCAKVETPLMTVAQHERIVTSLTRPAQTEQQPVAWKVFNPRTKKVRLYSAAKGYLMEGFRTVGYETTPLYAAPIAQTSPQPQQSGLPWPVIELLSRYKRDLERRTFPDNEQGAFDLRWTAKEIERASAALSAQPET